MFLQVDGVPNNRGKTKKHDKPGVAFDTSTGHQHMCEWRCELAKGVGDKDASARLLELAAQGLALAKVRRPSQEFILSRETSLYPVP